MDRKKKRKVPGVPTRTVDSVKDERFTHVLKNPVFRPVPKKEKKIDIDRRFESMFKDERFKLKYKVDKRGRPVETTTDENLRRYYNLEGDEDEETDQQISSKKTKDKIKKIPISKEESSEEEDSSESESEDDKIEGDVKEGEMTVRVPKLKVDEATRKKLHSAKVDYARGEANLLASEESSSDEDSSTDEEKDEFVVHDWGELDKDATRTEESTCRLALCNMDWDRVRAVDLMVILSSFIPPGGLIKSVKIYPSEFGQERMAEEEVKGPRELVEDKLKIDEFSDDENGDERSLNSDEEDDEGSRYHREKLRQYQLNRLRYYYAVVDFDSIQTAEKVYSECDGMEYESSSAKIDLRFIPDDMTFENEPKDECNAIPESSKYRPRFFTTTALQQVKVDLTWDETDPMRRELTEKIFDPKENVNDDDIRAYLATSSESEEEDGEEVEEEAEMPKGSNSKLDAISKYKSLLQSIESDEQRKKEKDVEMEITWGVGLKETTQKLVKKKLEEEEKANRTPWEEMIGKRREKRQQRKQEKKQTKNDSSADSSENEDEKQPFSDDDVDVDMNDEFFKSEMRNNEVFKDSKKSTSKKSSKTEEPKSKPGKDASLELLLMDEDDISNKNHFSLKKILENESNSKSKKKRGKKKRKLEEDNGNQMAKDNFEIDVEDQRFSALFNSHHYNVDPSDPNFKKTKAMEKIITEKQKRRSDNTQSLGTTSTNDTLAVEDQEDHREKKQKKAELSSLVKSIKRNTENNLKSKNKKIRR